MQRRFPRIHHVLPALPVLEAAARLGSFTRAGDELGLTQPTVSRHVMNLEEHFGTALFERHHNRLVLTAAGRQIADAAALGLGHIETAARGIAGGAEEGITLASSFGFAHQWLQPRFNDLRRALDGYPVHLVTADWLVGLDTESADLIISWSGTVGGGRPSLALFDETAFPVAAPRLLAERPELARGHEDASLLATAPLLHYDERGSDFLNWTKWFATQGVVYAPEPAPYLFSNYPFMIEAVCEGEGVGLGWRHMVDDTVAAGNLVQVGGAVRHRDAAYYLEYRKRDIPADKLDVILDWFRAQVA